MAPKAHITWSEPYYHNKEEHKISYIVCNMKKLKRQSVGNVERENERDETYEAKNPNIDSARTRNNYHIVAAPKSYLDFINARIASLCLKRKVRSDAIYMNTFVLGSGHAFFETMPPDKQLSHLTKLIKEVSLSPDADEKIALILKMASESITEDKIKGLVDKDDKRKVKSGILKFSKKEMDKMPTSLKNLFAHNDIIVRYRYYKGLFQARYRKNGMNIEVASTDFNTMKRKFIAKLCERQGDTVQPKQTKSTVTFADCAQAWLKLKERTTKPSTYKEYLRSYNVNLQPVFGDYRLCEITRGMVQDYLFSFVDKGNHRTAEKLKLQLKCIFDLAAEDYKIPSPMNKIVLPYRQTKKGRAFTYAEERKLVDFCTQKQDNAASSALLVLLYFGLRQSELASIRVVDGKYLECETSKERLGRNVVVRQIPFTPVFRRVEKYVDFAKAKATNPRTIATTLKRLFPEHHPHELRYTYITRVKEAGVNQELVMLWDGHSFDKDVKTSAVDRGYTTYSEEYILSEANKVDYTF